MCVCVCLCAVHRSRALTVYIITLTGPCLDEGQTSPSSPHTHPRSIPRPIFASPCRPPPPRPVVKPSRDKMLSSYHKRKTFSKQGETRRGPERASARDITSLLCQEHGPHAQFIWKMSSFSSWMTLLLHYSSQVCVHASCGCCGKRECWLQCPPSDSNPLFTPK